MSNEWIEWDGGKCPVSDGIMVDFVMRNGQVDTWEGSDLRWNHELSGGDIVRYRICAEQSVTSTSAHPLSAIFDAALAQVTSGKGKERHGNGVEFMEQPWLSLANTHGNGFLTGQAAKKLAEAQGMEEYDRWEREMLGSIVYSTMAIIHRRMSAENANVPPKVDNEWIECHCSKCPVDDFCEVEVKLRDGTVTSGAAMDFIWTNNGANYDIIRYRIMR